jgi:uncharacterized small protein (DUF1192 family)
VSSGSEILAIARFDTGKPALAVGHRRGEMQRGACVRRRCDKPHGRRYVFCEKRTQKMPAIEDDDKPKKKLAHEIGQDVSLLSLKELDERVAMLQDEIARLETARAKKEASRFAADQFFKR